MPFEFLAGTESVYTIDLFRLYILFSQYVNNVLILRRFGALFCSLKRVHADIFMLA